MTTFLDEALVGETIKDAQEQDFTLWFSTGKTCITTESLWRILSGRGVEVTSSDNGRQFGLPAPVDAFAMARELLVGKTISSVCVADRSFDLSLRFADSVELQFLNTSSGFESWSVAYDQKLVVCQGSSGPTFATVRN